MNQRGLTRIELLVVLAVLTVMAVRTRVPAIQRARESARPSLCKDHLKQIGLALYNYHDTFITTFPPGYVMNVDGVYHGWSWEVMMQPYMDASPFYNSVAQAIPNGLQSLPTQPQLSEVHSSLICPRTIGPTHVEHTIVCTSPVVDGVVTPGTFDWKNLF